MKYKVLALDLDGTLVTSNNKLSKINVQKMSQYIQDGGKICFVTGRTFNYAMLVADDFYKLTNQKIDMICALNGAYIYDNINEKLLDSNPIDDDTSKAVKAIVEKSKIISSFYTKESVENSSMYLTGISRTLQKMVHSVNKKKVKVMLDKDFDTHSTYKINIIKLFSWKQFDATHALIEKTFGSKVDVTQTKKNLFEITLKGIDKGYAIDFLVNYYNIPASEFLAAGDSGNDIPMFKKVGLDVAVNDERIKKLNYYPKVSLNKSTKVALAKIIDKYAY